MKSAIVAILIALTFSPSHAADWLMFGNGPRHDGYNGAEATLTPANAHRLVHKWTYSFLTYKKDNHLPLTTSNYSQPVVASGVNVGGASKTLVYIGDNGGTFHAVDANSTNADQGTLVWARQTATVHTQCVSGNNSAGIRSTAAIDRTANGGRGAVFVASNARVYAWDLATGSTISGWPDAGVLLPNTNASTGGTVFSGVTLYNGSVYVTTSSPGCDSPPYYGSINVLDETTGVLTKQWFTGSGSGTVPTIDGGAIWGPGGVSIDPNPTGPALFTATGNPVPVGAGNAVGYYLSVFAARPDLSAVDWTWQPANLGGDEDFGSTPVPIDPSACPRQLVPVVRKGGTLYVPEISKTTPRSLYKVSAYPVAASPDLSFGAVAFDPVSQLLLLTTFDYGAAPPPPFSRGLNALKVASDCSLSLAWQTNSTPTGTNIIGPGTRLTSVTVANGMAFFGVGFSSSYTPLTAGVFAVALRSGNGISAGQTLWHSTNVKAPVNNAPIVVNGRVFFAANDGKLRAYALP